MPYTFDKTRQLSEARAKGYKAQEAALRAQGVPTRQHNLNVDTKAPAKKASAKKASAKKTVKKATAKKTAKKTTKKS